MSEQPRRRIWTHESLLEELDRARDSTGAIERIDRGLCERVRLLATKVLSTIDQLFPSYTDHSVAHSDKVAQHLAWMTALADMDEPLSSLEIALLWCAAYLHDAGMSPDAFLPAEVRELERLCDCGREHENWTGCPAIRAHVRSIHHEQSLLYITRNWKELGFPDHHFARMVGDLSRHHRILSLGPRSELRDDAHYRGGSANLRLLAAFVRVADECDLDFERAPLLLYRRAVASDEAALDHWQRHVSIAGVGRDRRLSHRIVADAKLDVGPAENKAARSAVADLYRSLVDYETKLQTQLDAIQEDLRDIGGFPYYQFQVRVQPTGFHPVPVRFTGDVGRLAGYFMGVVLYKRFDAAVRELIQNAFDAIRLRSHIQARSGRTERAWRPVLSIRHSPGSGTLSVEDNGAGIELDIFENYIAAIGRSFYRSQEFAARFGEHFHATSRFGIGLLSCFMIADEIEILTRSMTSRELLLAHITSVDRHFFVHPERGTEIRAGGTRVTLKLKEKLGRERDQPMIDFDAAVRQWVMFPPCRVTFEGDDAVDSSEIRPLPRDAFGDSAVLCEHLQGMPTGHARLVPLYSITWRHTSGDHRFVFSPKSAAMADARASVGGITVNGSRRMFTRPEFRHLSEVQVYGPGYSEYLSLDRAEILLDAPSLSATEQAALLHDSVAACLDGVASHKAFEERRSQEWQEHRREEPEEERRKRLEDSTPGEEEVVPLPSSEHVIAERWASAFPAIRVADRASPSAPSSLRQRCYREYPLLWCDPYGRAGAATLAELASASKWRVAVAVPGIKFVTAHHAYLWRDLVPRPILLVSGWSRSQTNTWPIVMSYGLEEFAQQTGLTAIMLTSRGCVLAEDERILKKCHDLYTVGARLGRPAFAFGPLGIMVNSELPDPERAVLSALDGVLDASADIDYQRREASALIARDGWDSEGAQSQLNRICGQLVDRLYDTSGHSWFDEVVRARLGSAMSDMHIEHLYNEWFLQREPLGHNSGSLADSIPGLRPSGSPEPDDIEDRLGTAYQEMILAEASRFADHADSMLTPDLLPPKYHRVELDDYIGADDVTRSLPPRTGRGARPAEPRSEVE